MEGLTKSTEQSVPVASLRAEVVTLDLEHHSTATVRRVLRHDYHSFSTEGNRSEFEAAHKGMSYRSVGVHNAHRCVSVTERQWRPGTRFHWFLLMRGDWQTEWKRESSFLLRFNVRIANSICLAKCKFICNWHCESHVTPCGQFTDPTFLPDTLKW